MNGFEALTTFEKWDGSAAGLAPCLDAVEHVLSAILDSFKGEGHPPRRAGSSMALLNARARVQTALEATQAGEDPDPVKLVRLVGVVGGSLFWALAPDAQFGIDMRFAGHRKPKNERNIEWALRAEELKNAGVKHCVKALHEEETAQARRSNYKPISIHTVRNGIQKGRKLLKVYSIR